MKASLIEIGLPTDKYPIITPALKECLSQTHDLLIGQQTYDDQILLVVRLLSESTLQQHLTILSAAFNQSLINSFQVVSCYLFKVAFANQASQNSLRDFPLQIGESWFPDCSEEQAAYLCLHKPHINQAQISWLATQASILQWTSES